MKILLKILGILLILSGLTLLLTEDFLAGLFSILFGIYLLKYKKSNKQNKNANSKNTIESPKSIIAKKQPSLDQHFFFNVVGISKKNDRSEDIQKLIKEFVKDELEYGGLDKYEGMTNKEILEYEEDVYEVDIYGFDEISLEPEPENPYDSNAIKVIHDEIGHIGYVPRDSTDRVKTALQNDYDLEWKLVGGKMKYVDQDEYKVRTKTLNYGIVINIYYSVKATN